MGPPDLNLFINMPVCLEIRYPKISKVIICCYLPIEIAILGGYNVDKPKGSSASCAPLVHSPATESTALHRLVQAQGPLVHSVHTSTSYWECIWKCSGNAGSMNTSAFHQWERPIWRFPKMGVPQQWMVYDGKSHLQMDDLGVPPFMETHI